MLRRTGALAFIVVSLAMFNADATAAGQRSFVSGSGADVGTCTLIAPCRSLGYAITQTNPFGELIVLDSAGYGPVTITQSVSVIAPAGVYAGISVPSGQDGVVINGGGIRVKLEGLSINGQGGTIGINMLAGAELRIIRCEVANMAGAGISSFGTGGSIEIQRSTMRNNGGNGAQFQVVYVEIEDSKFQGNAQTGVYVSINVRASLKNVTVTGNNEGIRIEAVEIPDAYFTTQAQLDRVQSDRNTLAGVIVHTRGYATATARIMRSTVGFNHEGVSAVAEGVGGSLGVDVSSTSVSDHVGSGVSGTGAGVFMMATGNTVTYNSIGFTATSGAQILSALDNTSLNNNPDVGVTTYTKH